MADVDRLNHDFADRDPDRFASILADGDPDECERVIESLPANQRARIVARLPTARVMQLLDAERLRPTDWLVDAPFGEAVALLSRVPRDRRLELVNALDDRDRRQELLRNQQYPAHSVGALVEDIPLRVSAESQAPAVIAAFRKFDFEAHVPAVVVDMDGHYVGVVDSWRLLLDNPATGPITDYIVATRAVRPEVPSMSISDNAWWGSRYWLPVVDHRQRALGVVTREKALQAAVAQSTGASRHHDVLLDLLEELVKFCETVLFRSIFRKDSL